LIAAWASTSLSVNWKPASPEAAPENLPGNNASDLSIAEARRRGPSTIDYRRLDERLQRLVAEPSMVGLAVAVVENGRIRFLKGYGVTATDSNEPVTPDTISDGRPCPRASRETWWRSWRSRATFRSMHPFPNMLRPFACPVETSIARQFPIFCRTAWALFACKRFEARRWAGDPRLLRANLATLSAICSPGQCHAYQNVAYDAASEIVEKVTGKPYEQVVREQLFLPLGMSSATMTRQGLVGARSWARPHRGGKTSKPVEVTESYYRVPAAGGVNSSIKDLAVWMQAQMGEERKSCRARCWPTSSLPGPTARRDGPMRKFRERLAKATYGLGWRIYDYAGHTVVGPSRRGDRLPLADHVRSRTQ
jgi:beta-lactamase class C